MHEGKMRQLVAYVYLPVIVGARGLASNCVEPRVPVGFVKGIPQINIQKRMYLTVRDWSTHKRLQRLVADGSSIPQAPGTLNEIGEGACEEVGRIQLQELRYEGRDASPPSGLLMRCARGSSQPPYQFKNENRDTRPFLISDGLYWKPAKRN